MARSPGPFPVDPEVLSAIRPMALGDTPQVARLHEAAMGRSLWARLGPKFLEALYQELLGHPDFLAYVYERQGEVGGFIAGTTRTEGLLGRTLARGWTRLLPPLTGGLWRSPGALWPLIATPLYSRISPLAEIQAESLFCSFRPDLRGTRISGHINKVLFEELRRRGHRQVKITTEQDNQGAIRQLRSWGFQEAGAFRFYGKAMLAFRLELDGHPRLDP